MKCPTSLMQQETEQSTEVDFSEYMWMAEEGVEQFDRRVEAELWEEAFIEACFEQMLAEEEQQWYYPQQDSQLLERLNGLRISEVTAEQIANSKLNPEAPEFVPRYLQRCSPDN